MRKNILSIIFVLFVAGGSFQAAAEGASQGTVYGQPITEDAGTRIGDILGKPDSFVGKTVRVEGKIVEVCPSGCWFRLQDTTGVVYVNLYPSAFVIPQARGRHAIVQGVVKKEHINVLVVGTGVRIK